jgi:hypothetical protein
MTSQIPSSTDYISEIRMFFILSSLFDSVDDWNVRKAHTWRQHRLLCSGFTSMLPISDSDQL